MQSSGQRWVLIVCSAGFFILGVLVGGFVALRLFSPASPFPTLPLSALLEEAHRLLDKGQLAEAEKNYQAILARDPGNPEAITHIGNIAFQRGEIDKALSYYEEA